MVIWTSGIYPQVSNAGSHFGRNGFPNFTCTYVRKFTGICRQNSCTNIGGRICVKNGKQLKSNVSEQLFRNWQAASTYLSVARNGGAAASPLPLGCRTRPGNVRAEVRNRWVIGGVHGVGKPARGPSTRQVALLK
jgi:hypothetical protein